MTEMEYNGNEQGTNGWNANDEDEGEQGTEGRTNQGTRDDDEERQGAGEHSRDERRIILREPYEQIQGRIRMAWTNINTHSISTTFYTHGLAQGTGAQGTGAEFFAWEWLTDGIMTGVREIRGDGTLTMTGISTQGRARLLDRIEELREAGRAIRRIREELLTETVISDEERVQAQRMARQRVVAPHSGVQFGHFRENIIPPTEQFRGARVSHNQHQQNELYDGTNYMENEERDGEVTDGMHENEQRVTGDHRRVIFYLDETVINTGTYEETDEEEQLEQREGRRARRRRRRGQRRTTSFRHRTRDPPPPPPPPWPPPWIPPWPPPSMCEAQAMRERAKFSTRGIIFLNLQSPIDRSVHYHYKRGNPLPSPASPRMDVQYEDRTQAEAGKGSPRIPSDTAKWVQVTPKDWKRVCLLLQSPDHVMQPLFHTWLHGRNHADNTGHRNRSPNELWVARVQYEHLAVGSLPATNLRRCIREERPVHTKSLGYQTRRLGYQAGHSPLPRSSNQPHSRSNGRRHGSWPADPHDDPQPRIVEDVDIYRQRQARRAETDPHSLCPTRRTGKSNDRQAGVFTTYPITLKTHVHGGRRLFQPPVHAHTAVTRTIFFIFFDGIG